MHLLVLSVKLFISAQIWIPLRNDCRLAGWSYTGLFKMTVKVLTTCHTQYTWDRSICIFLFNRTTLQVFVTYLTCALYVHPLWFYKHQHDNRVRSTRNAFSLPFTGILVNCAPCGEMHNYCTPHIIKENSRISWPIGATTCSYLKCIVYDKLLKPRQSFWITLYLVKSVLCCVIQQLHQEQRKPVSSKSGAYRLSIE